MLFECLDLHLPRILCQSSSSVLAGFSSTVRIRLGFFPSRWKPLSCALGFSRCLMVHDGYPRVASPRPELQGGLLDCISLSSSRPGALRFPSLLSSVGDWVESGRLFSLEPWSPSSACGGCGSRSIPSPSRGSPGYSIEAGNVSLQFWALSQPFLRSCPAGIGSLAIS